jgi:hypothetical protein
VTTEVSAGRMTPSASAPAERPSSGAPAGTRSTSWRVYAALAFGCLLLAALSLLYPSTPSYDPWGWLLWGREIIHLRLDTVGYNSF